MFSFYTKIIPKYNFLKHQIELLLVSILSHRGGADSGHSWLVYFLFCLPLVTRVFWTWLFCFNPVKHWLMFWISKENCVSEFATRTVHSFYNQFHNWLAVERSAWLDCLLWRVVHSFCLPTGYLDQYPDEELVAIFPVFRHGMPGCATSIICNLQKT